MADFRLGTRHSALGTRPISRFCVGIVLLCLLAQCAPIQPAHQTSPAAQPSPSAKVPPPSPEELLERFNLFINRA